MVDRLLFYVFLLATSVVTVILLLFIPVCRRLFYDDEFDEKLFGIN